VWRSKDIAIRISMLDRLSFFLKIELREWNEGATAGCAALAAP
jgi:hypothetical protein